jgi:hypothetical protein
MIECRPLSELRGGDLGWRKAMRHFRIGDHGSPAHRRLDSLYAPAGQAVFLHKADPTSLGRSST